jgi:hypothetical protein
MEHPRTSTAPWGSNGAGTPITKMTELEEGPVADTKEPPDPLRTKLNRETAKIPWIELLRFFAQGRVVCIAPELDLVEIAAFAAEDSAEELGDLMAERRVAKVTDEQARRWLATGALLWTIVVKPWVFVQEPKPATEQKPL